jgi:membrane-associated protein
MSLLHIDLPNLIRTVGYIGLFAITFAESGLLIGFFLPGDSLLFTAGFLASQGLLNIYILTAVICAGAILGDSFGYAFGRKIGPKIFTKEDSLLFHKDHLVKAQKFFDKHGGLTLILARFTPVIRTFAPILAGVGKMRYGLFLTYNIMGGLLWGLSVTLSGFFIGKTIPGAERYVHIIVLIIIIISLIPSIVHILKNPESRAKLVSFSKNIFHKK